MIWCSCVNFSFKKLFTFLFKRRLIFEEGASVRQRGDVKFFCHVDYRGFFVDSFLWQRQRNQGFPWQEICKRRLSEHNLRLILVVKFRSRSNLIQVSWNLFSCEASQSIPFRLCGVSRWFQASNQQRPILRQRLYDVVWLFWRKSESHSKANESVVRRSNGRQLEWLRQRTGAERSYEKARDRERTNSGAENF